jgi:hypothetical protein
MRLRYQVCSWVAICGLTLAGCGKVDNTPPPDVTTDTPVLDIDQGIEVPADEVGTKADAAPQAPTDDAKTDTAAPAGGK